MRYVCVHVGFGNAFEVDATRGRKGHMAILSRTVLAGFIASVAAIAQSSVPPDLTQATLEDLMNIQVTSVSKKDQPAFKRYAWAGAALEGPRQTRTIGPDGEASGTDVLWAPRFGAGLRQKAPAQCSCR